MSDKIDTKGLESPVRPKPPSSIEEFVKQVHETCRHGFGLYVGWFTFFATLSLGAMGWLAKVDTEKPDPITIKKIAYAFIILTVLGIVSGVSLSIFAWIARARLIRELTASTNCKSIVKYSLPVGLYILNIVLMGLALGILCFLWKNFL